MKGAPSPPLATGSVNHAGLPVPPPAMAKDHGLPLAFALATCAAMGVKEFMVATFTDLILRVGLAIALSKALGAVGVWCAWPIGWSIAMVMSVRFYRRGPWEKA